MRCTTVSSPGLVRLAMVLVDDQEQAEEVVQDAFAGLYLRYRLVTTPLPYVRASVLNGSRKVLRRRLLVRRYPASPTRRRRARLQPRASTPCAGCRPGNAPRSCCATSCS